LLKIINSNINLNKGEEFIEKIKTLSDKIISLSNKIVIADLDAITDKMYHKIDDINVFFNINLQMVKKITKSEFIKNIEKKIESDGFLSNLDNLETYLLF
jgi:formiminotetrahydrofolate cyclodeaminase